MSDENSELLMTVDEIKTSETEEIVTVQEEISTYRSEKQVPLVVEKQAPLEVEEEVHKSHEDEIPPELEELLHTDPGKGLTSAEVADRLVQFGRNELSEVKRNAILHFLSFFTGAIAYLIEIAWILSGVTKDWINFGIIGALLLINALIGYIEEAKAESALDALKQTLALKTRCWRDGHLVEVEAAELVPGDVIVLRLGDIIPADARLLGIGVTGEATEGDLQVDQSALTGESLPVSRKKGHTVYSSSVVKQGQQLAVVTKTGSNTFIGRAANLISITVDEGHFQKIVNQIGNFLIYITVVLVVIIFVHELVSDKINTGNVDVLDALKHVLVLTVAARGLRALGVARTVPGDLERYQLVGMISLLDPPRPDSALTIRECKFLGVDVKMITGDQLIIAKEVAHRLGMGRVILDANHLVDPNKSEEEVTNHCERADGFAQVIPEHKYRVVELLQKKGLLVGMTGDGVNDAPALKKANVGIAVHGCTDAARSAADIVLLAPGLATIVDGIKTSRAIFQRMRSYALYRITSTVHFLIFFFIVTIAENWQMPAILLILICVLNDAATLVIAVDNTQISPKPDKWRLGQLITLSIVLACFLTIMSFAHYFVAKLVMNVTPLQLNTIMYLHISSCPHFVIFSTRVPGYLWENIPSLLFFVVIIATQIFAMLMSIYGLFGEGEGIGAIGWPWGLSVLAISFAYTFVLDFIKVQIFKWWSFENTVRIFPTSKRVAKLEARRAVATEKKRIYDNWRKARKVVLLSSGVVGFQNAVAQRKTQNA
ncbi:hypothetical protein BC938DRAFT_473443 [Jimgerdemannia flammicorona]|uniref:Proton pump n=1 Tax=Jimgerdemannia flammicorona TaxID=994334 RepID=A0A433Q453_9FUNG|nr:hypothetical protein BC938DRAFT_473443 [Jimgerdemannia flammicorona]